MEQQHIFIYYQNRQSSFSLIYYFLYSHCENE